MSSPSSPGLQHPPPYTEEMTLQSAAAINFGFPSGYFVIRSYTGRLMDVELDDTSDGAEIILWPEKDSSIVQGFRRPEADNQVFFIDTSGALCSKQSGHAIDIEGGRLILRHRRPISYPYPNAFSHPLPQFWYSSSTKQIYIRYQCDPSYPPPPPDGTAPSDAWRQKSYLLSSVPLRKPRSLLENASDVFNNVITSPLSPLTSLFGGAPQASVEEVHNSYIDLREDELLEEDRGEGEEVDDSPELLRRVRAIVASENETGITEATKSRRTWEVVPLRRARAGYAR